MIETGNIYYDWINFTLLFLLFQRKCSFKNIPDRLDFHSSTIPEHTTLFTWYHIYIYEHLLLNILGTVLLGT